MRLPIGSIDVSASGGTAELIGRRGDEWNRVSDSEISVDEAISLLDAGAQDGAHVDPARQQAVLSADADAPRFATGDTILW